MTRSQRRLVEQTPFLRYSREEIELFAEMVRARRVGLLPEANAGDLTSRAETDKLNALHRKLLDDLKMRP